MQAAAAYIQHGRFGDGCTLQLDLVHSECGLVSKVSKGVSQAKVSGVNGAVYNMFHGKGGLNPGTGNRRNTSRPKTHGDRYSPAAHRKARKRTAKAAAAARRAAVSHGDQADSD